MEYKIENEEITEFYPSSTDRNGQPYKSKKGNTFTKVDIYVDPRSIEDSDFQGKMTYFDYFDNMANYGRGQTISGIVKKVESNGRVYWNFEFPPSGKKALALDLKELEKRITELEEVVFKKARTQKEREVKEAIGFSKELLKDNPEEEEKDDDYGSPDDLPF